MTRVALRRARREDEILDAATRVLLRDGIDGLRAQSLAEAAGVSIATPYHYFQALDDVVAAVCVRARGDAQMRCDVARELAGTGPADQLGAVLAAPFERPEHEAVAAWAVWIECQRKAVFSPRLRALVVAGETAAIAQLAAITRDLDRSADANAPLDAQGAAQRMRALTCGLGVLVVLGIVSASEAAQLARSAVDERPAWRPAVRREPPSAPAGYPAPPAARDAAERILDAAIELIAREGCAGVTYADVAAAAGVSASLPRYHFPRRRLLLDAAFARDTALARQRMLHQATAADPLERLATIYVDGSPAGLVALRTVLVLWSEHLGMAIREEAMRTEARQRLETWVDYGLSLGHELAAVGAARAERIVRPGSLRQVAVNTSAAALWLIGALDDDAYPAAVNGTIDDELGRGR